MLSETWAGSGQTSIQNGFCVATLWEILANSQKYPCGYLLNQASKLAGKIFRDMEFFSISLKMVLKILC